MPASINYQAGLEGEEASVISPVWHELVMPNTMTCKSGEDGGSIVQGFVDPKGVDTGKRLSFEGNSYVIFKTGDSRIGVIAEVGDTNGALYPLGTTRRTIITRNVGTFVDFTMGLRFRIRLVALDTLPPGSLSFQGLERLVWQGAKKASSSKFVGASVPSISSSTIEVKNTTCALNVPSAVSLPKIALSHITDMGDVSETTSFQLSVNCVGAYVAYKINYMMTDVYKPGNISSSLSINTASGSASGVGIQVLDDGQVVTFEPASPTALKRSFGSMEAVGGSITKTMGARYVRTSVNATPGKVEAGATVTLSYQ